MLATCHCAAITVEASVPDGPMLECQRGVCYRYGAVWAYYPLDQVKITKADGVEPRKYVWGRKNIELTACERCNCLMYWWPIDEVKIKKMALNSRMVVERGELEGVEVKKS
nr:hypothetical protein B0A51_12439 [Rachicladosporium sp. CCFEE 5018]